jgi:hypothetical protein
MHNYNNKNNSKHDMEKGQIPTFHGAMNQKPKPPRFQEFVLGNVMTDFFFSLLPSDDIET